MAKRSYSVTVDIRTSKGAAMNRITRPTVAALLLLFSTLLVTSATAQQKRPTPARPQAKPTVAPTPAPTFETLVPADSYKIYGEIRSVDQLLQSNAVKELLDALLKAGGPSKEFRTLMKWLNAPIDETASSRLLFAAWPSNKELPDILTAMELESPEEAAKFATALNELLPAVLPPAPARSPDKSDNSTAGPTQKTTAPAKPNFNLQRFGSLIVITEKPLTLKQLKPAGSKPLFDDPNFRTARNRLSSEPVFVYIDVKAIEREDEQRRKEFEEENRRRVEASKAKLEEAAGEESRKTDENAAAAEMTNEAKVVVEGLAPRPAAPVAEASKEPRMSDEVATALTSLSYSFIGGESNWPDAVALALSFDDESFVARALLLNQPGEKSDVLPFVPLLIPGPALVPESPNILPADTELFATISLDVGQIYSTLLKPNLRPGFLPIMHSRLNTGEVEPDPPIATLEKHLKINIKDELLPLLGSEVGIRLPLTGANFLGLGLTIQMPERDSNDNSKNQQPSPTKSPVIVISLRDREGMRAFMPKLIDSLGFKGASSFAQTERREDTELVSYANLFSYAFVGNFLVLSSDPVATRYVVDSYLKHETLSSDVNFKNYTRWQPRPSHGQLYISPELMSGYKSWIEQPSTRISEQTKAYLLHLIAMAQPITYSLSNEGVGPLHELHVPKNLVLMAVVGISSEANPPADLRNERSALGTLYMISHFEEQYKADKGAGRYGTLEELIEAKLIPKEMIDNIGYKIEVTVSGDNFQVTAVPVEYGKTGNMSYFIDQTRILRGGDHHGAPATSSDPPIYNQ